MCPLQDGPHLRKETAGVVGRAEGCLQPAQPPLNCRGAAWPVSWAGGVRRVGGGSGAIPHVSAQATPASGPFRGAGRWNSRVRGWHRDVPGLRPGVCAQGNRDRVRSRRGGGLLTSLASGLCR